MHTSILSRSVIAVASLAIGSAALAAAPATATGASVTRDMVLSVADDVRAAEKAGTEYTESTKRKIDQMISQACNFRVIDENKIYQSYVQAGVAGHAEGVLVSADLHELADGDQGQGTYTNRECTFAVLATTDAAFTLSGRVTLSILANEGDNPTAKTTTVYSRPSGDVFVTAPISTPEGSIVRHARLSTSGDAIRPFTVTTPTKVAIPKSKAEKKAAKNAYAKARKKAKKAYIKALKKAGNSKPKKAAAKKAYAKKRSAAKARYEKAIVTITVVNKTTQHVEKRPFDTTAILDSLSPY